MKKIRILLGMLLTLFMFLPVYAQGNFGVLGGWNFANASVHPDQGLDWKTRKGFGFGAVLDYSVTDFITLHLEPMLLLKGTKAEQGEKKLEYRLTYVEIPVMFMYTIGTNTIKPYLMAGPTIGFLQDAKLKVTRGGDSEWDDLKDDLKSIDFGLGFGAGLNLPIGNNSIFVEARYSPGLMNIVDNAEAPYTDIKTRGIQIFVGITFPMSM